MQDYILMQQQMEEQQQPRTYMYHMDKRMFIQEERIRQQERSQQQVRVDGHLMDGTQPQVEEVK